VPKELAPQELALLVEAAERPRTGDWSLRAALVRYAQREPVRVGSLLEQVRRLEGVLQAHRKVLEQDGPALWQALRGGERPADRTQAALVEVLEETAALDRLGDRLATWAVDRAGDPPDAEVDAVTEAMGARLDALGVPREARDRPPRAGRRGRGV
jgi:hypothetical protein